MPGGVADRGASVADRQANLQNRMADARTNAGQNRGDFQQNRQDYLNNRREDWQNFANDHYGQYGNWHNGYWHGNAGGWWDHMWDDHTALMTLGVTRWGLNRVGSWFGYSSYANPYYDSGSGGGGYADYSEPVTMDATTSAAYATYDASAPDAAPLPPGVSQESLDKFDQARQAFYDGNYAGAQKLIDEALTKMPKDAVMHEFRALCLFAQKKYKEAAAVMNAVLAVGPGWDWTTLNGMYPSTDTYTAQLRALEEYVGKNPKSADGHFLVAYHYITIGENDQAKTELKKVIELQPNDTVAAYLLQMMTPGEPPTPPANPPAAPPTIPTDSVVGKWTASGPKNAKYEMTLAKDGTFVWSFSRGATKQEVKGVYAIDGITLAMQPDGGGNMVMDLKLGGADSLHADILGATKGDPGLDFKRTGK
jgi:tetratricopeptide (TPR) repeat protein